MSSVSGSSSRSTWSSVSSRSPAVARRTMIRPSWTRGRVEGVDRLAQLDHHVVRGVDDVADRALPGGQQAHLDPVRRRADADAARPSDRRTAGTGRGPGPRPARRSAAGRPVFGHLGRRQPERPRRSRPPPRARGPTIDSASPRFGLTSTSSTTSPYSSVSGAPERRVGGQDQDPVGVAGQPELVARAEHAVADDAHLLGPLDPPVARQDRAGQRHRHALAGGDVRRAADDRRAARRDPTVTRVSDSRSARGWRSTESSSPTTTLRQSSPQRSMPLTSMPSSVSRSASCLGRQVDVDELAQPAERHPHRNCSRKRRSFSRNRRRSVMPCLSILIRSGPIPKAKPW